MEFGYYRLILSSYDSRGLSFTEISFCFGSINDQRIVRSGAKLFARVCFIIFRVSRRRREMYSGHACLSVCLSVCVSVRGRMPTLLHGPGCNLGEW